jgi:maltooligosyltrehalose trehalohydrolase
MRLDIREPETVSGLDWQLNLGATLLQDGTVSFRVWAPRVRELSVVLPNRGINPALLAAEGNGYFSGSVAGVAEGEQYLYLLDGETARPDPASRFQPEGVHGPSQVVAADSFVWSDNGWKGISLDDYIIYELHVGTFTTQGTFDGVITRLDYLCELGITAVELMPVSQFPGERNWGYDGVYPFAPQNSYGGPEALKRLVDACHSRGLAVILDVVYNHLGPEGNYLNNYGPYFTDRYHTPWGDAVNFDGPDSDPVRYYFISNALYWITEYHIDALRLDAIHGIYDFSALHILQELSEAVHRQGAALGRRVHVIAESDLNDVRVINSPESGGYGLDAQWNDDFHHALRALLTGEQSGYYGDFGLFSDLAKGFREGFVLSGGYSSFRRRRHGNSSAHHHPCQLVAFSQNHDQVGNRMRGERPGEHLSTQQLKLSAATVLLSPYVPLLFMGEEYAESAPFPYFVSHGDAELIESVRRGRCEEFSAFAGQGTPPDPQSEETFLSAKLDQEQRKRGEQRAIFDFYRELIRLRKECPPLARLERENMHVVACEEERVLVVTRSVDNVQLLCLFNYSDQTRVISPALVGGTMTVLLDSTRSLAPDSRVTVYTTRPETFTTLAPFGVMVYRALLK